MKTGIYILRNVVNGKVYVGSAVDVAHRWVVHRSSLERGDHHSAHLQRAWNQYGPEAFEFVLIESVVLITDLLSREQHWIDHFEAADPRYGYNVLTRAGDIPSWRGRKQTPQHVAKRAYALRGIRRSEETKAKLRVARSRQAPATAESREKNRRDTQSRWLDPAYRATMVKVSEKRWAGDARAKRSRELKRLWKDGAFDNRAVDHEELSAAAKAREQNPKLRVRQSKAAKRRWANPAERTTKAKTSKALWLDPEYRAKVLAGQEAARQRKKAIQERPDDEHLN